MPLGPRRPARGAPPRLGLPAQPPGQQGRPGLGPPRRCRGRGRHDHRSGAGRRDAARGARRGARRPLPQPGPHARGDAGRAGRRAVRGRQRRRRRDAGARPACRAGARGRGRLRPAWRRGHPLPGIGRRHRGPPPPRGARGRDRRPEQAPGGGPAPQDLGKEPRRIPRRLRPARLRREGGAALDGRRADPGRPPHPAEGWAGEVGVRSRRAGQPARPGPAMAGGRQGRAGCEEAQRPGGARLQAGPRGERRHRPGRRARPLCRPLRHRPRAEPAHHADHRPDQLRQEPHRARPPGQGGERHGAGPAAAAGA